MYSTSICIHIYIRIHMHASYIKWRFLFRFTLVVRFSHTLCLSAYGLYQISIQKASLTSSRSLDFFSRWSGRGYTFTCMIRACHARYQWNKKFIQIPTQRQQKIRNTHTHSLHKENCVPVSYSFFFFFRVFYM